MSRSADVTHPLTSMKGTYRPHTQRARRQLKMQKMSLVQHVVRFAPARSLWRPQTTSKLNVPIGACWQSHKHADSKALADTKLKRLLQKRACVWMQKRLFVVRKHRGDSQLMISRDHRASGPRGAERPDDTSWGTTTATIRKREGRPNAIHGASRQDKGAHAH